MPVTLAQAALKFAKVCTPLGPDNQSTGALAPPKPWNPGRGAERVRAAMAVSALKPTMPPAGCSMADVVNYGREAMKQKAGNCFEQCAAACLYLAGRNENPVFHLAHLAPPADHVFVVLDQPPDATHAFPDQFAAWNANAVIVDPWVSICCKARNYPEMWRLKLDVMSAAGEELPSGTGRGWSRANAQYWTTAPLAHRKLSYTR